MLFRNIKSMWMWTFNCHNSQVRRKNWMIQSGCLLTKFRFGFVKKSMEICLFCSLLVTADIAHPSHFNIDQQTTIFFLQRRMFNHSLFFWKSVSLGLVGGRVTWYKLMVFKNICQPLLTVWVQPLYRVTENS